MGSGGTLGVSSASDAVPVRELQSDPGTVRMKREHGSW